MGEAAKTVLGWIWRDAVLRIDLEAHGDVRGGGSRLFLLRHIGSTLSNPSRSQEGTRVSLWSEIENGPPMDSVARNSQ
jgi:hypothetical protein